MLYFFNNCMHVAPGFRDAPGYRTRCSRGFAIKTITTAELVRMATMDKNWDTLAGNGFIIAGSPAIVADRLIEAAKTVHAGNLIALLQIGSMPHDLTQKNISCSPRRCCPGSGRIDVPAAARS